MMFAFVCTAVAVTAFSVGMEARNTVKDDHSREMDSFRRVEYKQI